MSYVTKLGAYGLAVAAAFAVALAVLVSVSTTSTAEAADVPLAEDGNSATAAPGDTVQIAVNGALAQVSITGTADGVGGSFVANDGQSISCSDNLACDENDTAGEIQVDLKVDADSGEGFILVSVLGVGGATPSDQATKVITVSKATLLGSLKVTAASKTIAATGGSSSLTVTVKNASATPGPLNRNVSLITTLGNFDCDGTRQQVCAIDTDGIDEAAGSGRVILYGGGVEGTATVTATLGSLTSTVDVTLFGSAKNLSAVPDQGSIEIGGSVYVVLTVTDGAGNPVSGQMVTPVTDKEVVGPGDDPVEVVTERDTAADGDSLVGRGYSKDKPAAGSAAAIPACGDDNTDTDADDSGLQELFGPNDGTGDAGEGTSDKGQCVVFVTAPEDTADADNNATRGEHTLNFAIGSIKASATIEVAGKPSSISTDAAEMVEPGSVTEITVSVFDDEDVLVGITSVKVRKVDGGGLIEDEGEGGSEDTANGQSKFTFIAPSSPGSSEILITAGDVNHRVALQIGEAMEEPEEPAMPEGATLSGNAPLMIFSGGSVEDLHSAAEAACSGGAVVWIHDGSAWQVYSTTAIAIANSAFNAAFAGGIDMQAVWVSSCEADSMESEG